MKSWSIFILMTMFCGSSIASASLLLKPQGNYCGGVNSECVRIACLHGYCDLDSDLEVVSRACDGVEDAGCLSLFCNQRGDCDLRSRFIKYADLCAGRLSN